MIKCLEKHYSTSGNSIHNNERFVKKLESVPEEPQNRSDISPSQLQPTLTFSNPMSSTFTFYSQINNSPDPLSKYDSASCLLQCDQEELNSTRHYESQLNSKQLLTNPQVQLRFLNPNDYDRVKGLCEEWFPVEYPVTWFQAITSDPSFYSLAAILNREIIGLIVSELRPGHHLGSEDRDLLDKAQLKKYSVAYILSLGVVDSQRRNGIASLLLSSLLNHLSTLQVKAVYLHVLTSNEPAIRFYEKHKFRVHKFLPYYYCIGGRGLDGFTYVLYMNRGHGPWGIHDYVNYFCQMTVVEICSWPTWCLSQVRRLTHSVITFIR